MEADPPVAGTAPRAMVEDPPVAERAAEAPPAAVLLAVAPPAVAEEEEIARVATPEMMVDRMRVRMTTETPKRMGMITNCPLVITPIPEEEFLRPSILCPDEDT